MKDASSQRSPARCAGGSVWIERRPSKPDVAGSNPAPRALAFAFLLVLTGLLSGCTKAPTALEASAQAGWIFQRGDYDYDGSRAKPARGNLTVRVDDEKDEATIWFDLSDGRTDFKLDWVSVSAKEPWMDGGVERSISLHGTTGNGSAELPEFFAYAAIWGQASVRVLGALERDPTTGSESFNARAYVVRGHVRDRDSGAIVAGTGQPYDPKAPDRAAIDPQGAQVLIELRTATGSLWRHFSFDDARLKGV